MQKKIFLAVFTVFAGLILAQIVDPATAQRILSLITGTGREGNYLPYFFLRVERCIPSIHYQTVDISTNRLYRFDDTISSPYVVSA